MDKKQQAKLLSEIMQADDKDGLYKQQTAVEWLYTELIKTWYDIKSSQELLEQAKQMEKEQLIAFHKWMLANDTEQNAEKYFHYSDEDMWHEFLNSK
jgi:hypothetical protein